MLRKNIQKYASDVKFEIESAFRYIVLYNLEKLEIEKNLID